MPHIAILGAGQIGSRHLQSLARIGREIDISVVDPKSSALNEAQSRFDEMPTNELVRSVSYFESSSSLNKDIDIAIVATNADVRKEVVEDLLKQTNVLFMILEKVAFQTTDDFQAVMKSLAKNNTKAWVNCTRRMFPLYKRIKGNLCLEEKLFFHFSGGKWGLGSNSIHVIDLFAFLTGETKIFLDKSGLDKNVYRSKRSGLIEFGGILNGRTVKGSQMTLFDHRGTEGQIVIQIVTKSIRYIVFETDKSQGGGRNAESKVIFCNGKTDWQWNEKSFRMPYQSELTHLAVQQIMDSGNCDLTPLDESFVLHIPMLKAFNEHLENITGKIIQKCPIT